MKRLVWGALLFVACMGGRASEVLFPTATPVLVSSTSEALSATPALADERGGGLFVDLAGHVVRLKPNGTRGALESHPANVVWPGPASAVWPLGPSSALAVTSRGVFVAEEGWLIAPPWQASLDPSGIRAVAVSADGIAWVAHAQGLYRVEGGQLGQLSVTATALADVTHVAVAPSPDGHPGVWFASGGQVSCAAQTARNAFTVTNGGLTADDLAGGVVGLVGLAPSPASEGELWLVTPHQAMRFAKGQWQRFSLSKTPRQFVSAGRFAWLELGNGLWRYDADRQSWLDATGLDSSPTLLAVDASGRAWVRTGAVTQSVGFEPELRVLGLSAGAELYEGAVPLSAALPGNPTELSWAFDDATPTNLAMDAGVRGPGLETGLTVFNLGGYEVGGQARPVSLGTLNDGRHTLHVQALVDGLATERKVHFEFYGSATAVITYDKDLKPLNEGRCAKCHSAGTKPELATYEQWKTHAAAISAAVTDKRMPADGPLDPTSIRLISRWVSGGALP